MAKRTHRQFKSDTGGHTQMSKGSSNTKDVAEEVRKVENTQMLRKMARDLAWGWTCHNCHRCIDGRRAVNTTCPYCQHSTWRQSEKCTICWDVRFFEQGQEDVLGYVQGLTDAADTGWFHNTDCRRHRNDMGSPKQCVESETVVAVGSHYTYTCRVRV